MRAFRPIRAYDIAVTASSVAGTTTSTSATRHVLLSSNVGCYVAWAASAPSASVPGATPVVSQVRVTANFPLVIAVPPSQLFAAIEDVTAATGVVTVTELDG